MFPTIYSYLMQVFSGNQKTRMSNVTQLSQRNYRLLTLFYNRPALCQSYPWMSAKVSYQERFVWTCIISKTKRTMLRCWSSYSENEMAWGLQDFSTQYRLTSRIVEEPSARYAWLQLKSLYTKWVFYEPRLLY